MSGAYRRLGCARPSPWCPRTRASECAGAAAQPRGRCAGLGAGGLTAVVAALERSFPHRALIDTPITTRSPGAGQWRERRRKGAPPATSSVPEHPVETARAEVWRAGDGDAVPAPGRRCRGWRSPLQDSEAALTEASGVQCPSAITSRPRAAPREETKPAPASASRRLLRRDDRVGPYAFASVYIDAERPTAGERLLYLLARRIFVEGMNGQLRLDLNEERPLLLGPGPRITCGARLTASRPERMKRSDLRPVMDGGGERRQRTLRSGSRSAHGITGAQQDPEGDAAGLRGKRR